MKFDDESKACEPLRKAYPALTNEARGGQGEYGRERGKGYGRRIDKKAQRRYRNERERKREKSTTGRERERRKHRGV